MYAAAGGVDATLDAARAVLDEVSSIEVDYLHVRGPGLEPDPASGPARLLVAARLGGTRLIDNIAVDLGSSDGLSPDGSQSHHELPWRN